MTQIKTTKTRSYHLSTLGAERKRAALRKRWGDRPVKEKKFVFFTKDLYLKRSVGVEPDEMLTLMEYRTFLRNKRSLIKRFCARNGVDKDIENLIHEDLLSQSVDKIAQFTVGGSYDNIIELNSKCQDQRNPSVPTST